MRKVMQEASNENLINHQLFSHNGKYTIQNRVSGEHRTFRVKTQRTDATFAPGKRIAALLTGPDNMNAYTGFGFVEAEGITVWHKKTGGPYDVYARMLFTLVVDGAFSPYADRYSLQASTVCRICNRTLTDPESIRSGIGPVCAGRSPLAPLDEDMEDVDVEKQQAEEVGRG